MKNYLSIVGLIILAYVAALGIRLDRFQIWNQYPSLSYVDNKPLILTFDGYYYLELAKEIKNGKVSPFDRKRAYPRGVKRKTPFSLLSYLTALISRATGIPLLTVACYLPMLLGSLIVLPVFLLTKEILEDTFSAFIASVLSSFSAYYLIRSGPGWYDTDFMNLIFFLFQIYFFYKFATEKNRKIIKNIPFSYIYLFFAFLTSSLFYWWWDQAHSVVSLFTLLFFVFSLIFYKPSIKEALAFLSFPIALILMSPYSIYSLYYDLLSKVYYVVESKTAVSTFPSIGSTISEQSKADLLKLVYSSSGNLFVFISSILGLVFLVFKKNFKAVLSVPLIFLGFIISLKASRFLIYSAPVIGLFLASFVFYFSNYFNSKKQIIKFALLIVFSIPMLMYAHSHKYLPKLSAAQAEALIKAGETTNKNSLIWIWWDYGHPTRYFADRATIADGEVHPGSIVYHLAQPYAASSYRLAANWMNFYANYGTVGFEKLKAAYSSYETASYCLKMILSDPSLYPELKKCHIKDGLKYFFPDPKIDLYLEIDSRLASTSYWWYWFASWDFNAHSGSHILFYQFRNTLQNEKGDLYSSNFYFNKEKGVFSTKKKNYQVSRYIYLDNKMHIKEYSSSGPIFVYNKKLGRSVLASQKAMNTLFAKTYFLLKYDKKYFDLVFSNYPTSLLFKVKPDHLSNELIKN